MQTEAKIIEATSPPSKDSLREEFEKYADIRHLIISDLKEQTEEILVSLDSNIVVSSRSKNFLSYYSKYLRQLKAGEKNPQILDLMGIRIICPFIEDLNVAETLINKKFNVVETEIKGHFTYKEFGYESTHIMIAIPPELIDKHGYPGTNIAEIQIRTILQDAWAEVEHELVYKAEFSPFDEPMRRKLSAINASLSLADIIFQEIRSHQRKYSRELDKRRESFYSKIEESTDNQLFAEELNKKNESLVPGDSIERVKTENITKDKTSIDDLLVNALSYHNENRFTEAISEYSRILELKPGNDISSVIYKHRGMANFACSQYKEAIEDFSNSLEYDNNSYKTAYYRGVVHSVLKQYAQAIDDYTLSLSINPYQPFCLFRRGQAFYHIGDLPHALSDCDISLALEPSNKLMIRFKELLQEKLKM